MLFPYLYTYIRQYIYLVPKIHSDTFTKKKWNLFHCDSFLERFSFKNAAYSFNNCHFSQAYYYLFRKYARDVFNYKYYVPNWNLHLIILIEKHHFKKKKFLSNWQENWSYFCSTYRYYQYRKFKHNCKWLSVSLSNAFYPGVEVSD